MIFKISLVAAVLALASTSSAAPSATPSPTASAPVPPPVIPLPPFNGTFAGDYPTLFATAPTNTTLVQKWLSELNLTADLNVCPLGVWGLTYDDGPTEFSTKLYDFLDTTNQKATLFYIGTNVVQNWQAARRACGAGHQIAVHTWSHNPSTSLTNEQFVAEVKYTEMAIKELCGFTPTYFRPPYGDIDNRIRGLLWAMGYTSVIWDYDTNDWQMDPASTQTAVTPTSIGTLFDGWIAASKNDTAGHITLEHELYQSTVDVAIANLPKIQATWKTMPVSACMGDAHPYRETNITLATINGGTTGVSTGTNTSTTTTLPSGASPSNGGSTTPKSGTSGAASAFVLKDMKIVSAVTAAAAIAFSQLL
ncbi:chitin deacetylase [Dissophora globulifera]|nr:chitin deacetylase [Dissophora globulifera]